MNRNRSDFGQPCWAIHAEELAEWVVDHLVNRTDCYGAYYYHLGGHHPSDFELAGKPIPVRSRTVVKPLTVETIRRHFQAFDARDLIGIHSTSSDDTCRWIEIDIDQHQENATEVAKRNAIAALAWYRRLLDFGFQPLLWHSNGHGGFRLNVRFSQPLPATEAYSFGHWLVRDWREFGLPGAGPDVFPKQRSIKNTEKQLGNVVRLPGRHHKHGVYPVVFNGDRWLRDEEAIAFILQLGSQPGGLIPDEARKFEPQKPSANRQNGSSLVVFPPITLNCGNVLDQAKAILEKWRLPVAGERNHTLFRAGCTIGERLPLSQEDHLQAMMFFNSKLETPLAEAEVAKVAKSSFQRTTSKRGGICYPSGTVEQFSADTSDPVVSLEEYRRKLKDQYRSVLGKPGIYLDTTPVGGGKTYQGCQTAGLCTTSLHVIPTHKNKEELVQGLANHGGLGEGQVAAFPERNENNCHRMDEVMKLYKLGIFVPSALCSTCEFRKDCPHINEKDRAEAAPHSVATMARMELNQLSRIGSGRDFIKIDENCLNLLRPLVKVGVDDLRAVVEAVKASLRFISQADDLDIKKCSDFFKTLKEIGEATIAAITDASTTCSLPVGETGKLPKLAEFVMTKGFQRAKTESRKKLADAKELLFGIVSGELHRCVIQVDQEPDGEFTKSIVGVWKTDLPRNDDGEIACPIIFADGTSAPELLMKIISEPVIDITPKGAIQTHKRVVQVPIDIKRSTRPAAFLNLVRGLLVANPSKKRVGIICHSNHHQGLSKLGKNLGSRIIKTAYFGSGEDRASNEWLDLDLDLLLVIGTPRIGPSDLTTKLIQLDFDKKAPASSKWGVRWWEGRNERGERVLVKTRRYEDPIWQRVYELEVHAALRQAIGRARAILSNGIDTIVVTCEPLRLPLVEESVPLISRNCERVLDLIATGDQTQGLNKAIVEQLGLSMRRAYEVVAELCDAGLINKIRRGHYELSAYESY